MASLVRLLNQMVVYNHLASHSNGAQQMLQLCEDMWGEAVSIAERVSPTHNQDEFVKAFIATKTLPGLLHQKNKATTN